MGIQDVIAAELTKKLTDEGKLIEAGFVAFRQLMINPEADAMQVDEMRLAFMAGAEHVFHSMISVLDEGEEPTEQDLQRMDNIHTELMAWRDEFTKRLKKETP